MPRIRNWKGLTFYRPSKQSEYVHIDSLFGEAGKYQFSSTQVNLDYGLADRINLIRSDLFSNLSEKSYDLIICNPPYVTALAMENLPPEYRHEPGLALAGGEDGLDAGVFEDASAALKHDRVVVDDENGRHDAVLA